MVAGLGGETLCGPRSGLEWAVMVSNGRSGGGGGGRMKSVAADSDEDP